ncbi:MAG: B12-binding domain-containing radical SAM protein [Eubacteriales bacterium]|nr:B12-binding domain-containing radical SAM protein [Eubacteriales bacterium]
MKVVLAALNAKYVHSNLAVYDIEAYTKKHWADEQDQYEESLDLVVREYTINHNLDMILQSLYQEKAAVVAFSCYIWNIQEILTIAKELYKVAPKTRIWLGGPEVSYDSENRLAEHPFVEGIMQGEGEATFYELITKWAGQNQPCYDSVCGIVFRKADGTICQNPVRPLMSLDEIPFIYEDLTKFENKILYYETSRGCPFSCSYCLSSIDKSVRFRSLSLVEKELEFFLKNKVSQVKFIDRTFNCKREHSLAIWNYLMEHDNGVTNFHFEVAADLIGEEEIAVFEKMRPGLIQLEIGLQSTNPETIKEIRRVMDVDKLKETLLKIRSFRNIHQHLDLIAGLPYENYITFIKSFNQAYEMKPDQLQLGFLKVLKGSYMGEQVKNYELQYQDTQPYEVLSTKWISYDEILQLKQVEEMVEVYYNSAQFEHVLEYLVPMFEHPYAFYEALGKYYAENDLFGIGFKREARYEAIRIFMHKWFEKSDEKNDNVQKNIKCEVLDALLTYDYYLRENAKSRPSWSKEEPIDKKQYQDFFRNAGNEEIVLQKDGYDSKVAARIMHIEPIVKEAIKWIAPNSKEVFEIDANTGKNKFEKANKIIYCLFDYEQRNPLSKEAKVYFASTL